MVQSTTQPHPRQNGNEGDWVGNWRRALSLRAVLVGTPTGRPIHALRERCGVLGSDRRLAVSEAVTEAAVVDPGGRC